jgi:hypothetical protein
MPVLYSKERAIALGVSVARQPKIMNATAVFMLSYTVNYRIL